MFTWQTQLKYPESKPSTPLTPLKYPESMSKYTEEVVLGNGRGVLELKLHEEKSKYTEATILSGMVPLKAVGGVPHVEMT